MNNTWKYGREIKFDSKGREAKNESTNHYTNVVALIEACGWDASRVGRLDIVATRDVPDFENQLVVEATILDRIENKKFLTYTDVRVINEDGSVQA